MLSVSRTEVTPNHYRKNGKNFENPVKKAQTGDEKPRNLLSGKFYVESGKKKFSLKYIPE